MAKRVFICEFHEESDSFTPMLSGMENYLPGMLEGEELVAAGARAGGVVYGMAQVLEQEGAEVIGGTRMSARSGGPVEHGVVDQFLTRTTAALRAAGHLDGVLVALHGATVSDASDDVCGDILTRVRELVGPEVPVAAACDLHANITRAMAAAADYICGYQTYPHLDQVKTGRRAAELLCRRMNGEALYMACVSVPMMAPPHAYTTGKRGLGQLMAKAHGMQESGRVEDFTIFQVQPWLDVPEISSCVLTVARSAEEARRAAEELAADEFALRRELQGEPGYTVEQVAEIALANTEHRPVVLVDAADSPNAGATGDSAAPLEGLLPYRDRLRIAVSVNDPGVVEQAMRLGVGARGTFLLGGSLAPKLSSPVRLEDAEVVSLHTGNYPVYGPDRQVLYSSIGRAAVLRAGKINILVAVNGHGEGTLAFYRGFGIDPTMCDLVCVKACTSFRASYEPIAARICPAITPGAANPALTELPFERLPKPLYPFQEITADMIVSFPCRG